jgi:Tfp pilus assembly protein PilF
MNPSIHRGRSVREPRQATKEILTPGRFVLLVFGCALLLVWILYSPAIQAPFVFDDVGLPFHRTIREEPLSAWVTGVRPVLMASYWLNRTLWGDSPVSYHVVNLFIHALNTTLVFLVLRRLLTRAAWAEPQITRAAIIGTAIFLIHPLQTESVSYVAGRSESLAALFMLLAYTLFLYRRGESISWLESIGVLLLFAIGVKTKENGAGLTALLILTDLFWPKPFSFEGIRKNWKLYALMVPGAALAVFTVLPLLMTAPTAGFSLRTFTWYQYAFTEARAIFTYIRFALWPAPLSIDHDFAVSHTVWEHGAVIWMILLVLVVAGCIRWRRQYPLASFGTLFFLLALAPTSSIIPIADPLVERRMYLPLVGLILIGCELSRHIRLSAAASTAMATLAALLLTVFCYARNQEWSHPEELMAVAAQQSTHNLRPYINLTETLVHEHHCEPAIPYLQRADQLFPKSYDLEVAWGWALECTGRYDESLTHLREAARMIPNSRAYEWVGLLYGEMHRTDEAGVALHKAVELDPSSVSAHEALALWYESIHDYAAAEGEHAKSVALDPDDRNASAAFDRVHELQAQPEDR